MRKRLALISADIAHPSAYSRRQSYCESPAIALFHSSSQSHCSAGKRPRAIAIDYSTHREGIDPAARTGSWSWAAKSPTSIRPGSGVVVAPATRMVWSFAQRYRSRPVAERGPPGPWRAKRERPPLAFHSLTDVCRVSMLICMRTTLNLDDERMRLVRRRAAHTDRTITQFIETALHDALAANAHGQPPCHVRMEDSCAVGFVPEWTLATATHSSTGWKYVRDCGGHEDRVSNSVGYDARRGSGRLNRPLVLRV